MVHAEITLFETQGGGRKQRISGRGGYKPHVRVNGDEMLGVELVGGRQEIEPGESAQLDLVLLYDVDYSSLQPGAEFTILEGNRPVGTGVIL
jgi:translation elongation factor EF-Tu-like GTPase